MTTVLKYRIYDTGPVLANTLQELEPGQPPNYENRYYLHEAKWVDGEIISDPSVGSYSWWYLDGEFTDEKVAEAEVKRLEAEWRASFVNGRPPVVVEPTVERAWACPMCNHRLKAEPFKWNGELTITCVCGQVQFVSNCQVSIDYSRQKRS